MPIINLPALPTASANDPLLKTKEFSNPGDAYNTSIHSPRDPSLSPRGLMSGANGYLTHDNLDDNFRLGKELVMMEQAVLSRSEDMLDTTTIYADGVSNIGSTDQYFTIPGCSVRWYQPYDATYAIMQWSLFASFNCWRGMYRDKSGFFNFTGVDAPIKIRCVLDGTAQEETTRHLGANMFHPIAPGEQDNKGVPGPGIDFYDDRATYKGGPFIGGNPSYIYPEAHSAQHFDMHVAGAISKGYHEISIECAMNLPDGDSVYVQNAGTWRRQGMFKGRGFFDLTGKVSLGIRNARVLALL